MAIETDEFEPNFVDAAFDLAVRSPVNELPCPVCMALVRGGELEQHLEQTHGIASSDLAMIAGGRQSGVVPRVEGADRSIRAEVLIGSMFGLSIVLMMAFIQPLQSSLSEGETGLLLLLTMVLPLGLFMWRYKGARAKLNLYADQLEVRAAWGLLHRRIAPPFQIVAGKYLESAPSNIGDQSTTRHAGYYVRLRSSTGTIVVACKSEWSFPGSWDPATWEPGKQSKKAHIRLSPEKFVALEYWLAERGIVRFKDSGYFPGMELSDIPEMHQDEPWP